MAAATQGRVDAEVLDQSILIANASVNKAVKAVGEPFTTDPYGIGTPNDKPEAKAFVDAWLQKIYDDGSWAKLWKATIGTMVVGDPPPVPKIGSVPGPRSLTQTQTVAALHAGSEAGVDRRG